MDYPRSSKNFNDQIPLLGKRSRHQFSGSSGDEEGTAAKRLRREKNRLAAAKSRQKKNQQAREMQEQIDHLAEKNNTLTQALSLMTGQVQRLQIYQQENASLRDRIHALEIENTRLVAERNAHATHFSYSHPTQPTSDMNLANNPFVLDPLASNLSIPDAPPPSIEGGAGNDPASAYFSPPQPQTGANGALELFHSIPEESLVVDGETAMDGITSIMNGTTRNECSAMWNDHHHLSGGPLPLPSMRAFPPHPTDVPFGVMLKDYPDLMNEWKNLPPN